jgi:DNA-binding NarL/FixJ family response regulator
MTRLLFLPDEHSLVVLDSPLPASALAACVNQGQWTPPEPFAAINPAALHAIRLGKPGRTVIVTPCLPTRQVRRLLKPRQRQVLRLLAHGLSNKEIAARLHLHPRTVALHMAALKEFFGASSPAQSVKRAVEMGMVDEQADD